jgi:hypothetical protein
MVASCKRTPCHTKRGESRANNVDFSALSAVVGPCGPPPKMGTEGTTIWGYRLRPDVVFMQQSRTRYAGGETDKSIVMTGRPADERPRRRRSLATQAMHRLLGLSHECLGFAECTTTATDGADCTSAYRSRAPQVPVGHGMAARAAAFAALRYEDPLCRQCTLR